MIDYLILGGGSAGCALAARLSEDPKITVTLVEAGRDLRPDTMTDIIRARYPGRAMFSTENIWASLEASISNPGGNGPSSKPVRYEQARILGGGSVINAMVANRGAPGDYDEWGALGADGWSWEAALPYFRKLERDCDFDNEFHGKTGPIPIRRLPKHRVSAFPKAVCDTLVARGYKAYLDQNGAWTDGVFPAAIVLSDTDERVPVSIAYLTPDVRKRANLRLITDRQVERLVLDGSRVVGADTAPADPTANGPREQLRAANVVLCCGGIHSPAMLMRNGIGPADQLQKLGIPVVANLPGVGQNLMEHAGVALSTYLPPHARMPDPEDHHDQALLRYTSSIPDAVPGDMHVAILARTGWHAVGHRTGTLFMWVNKTYSRGTVTLASADPKTEPKVDFRLLSDWRDMDRLKEGYRLLAGTLRDPRLNGIRSHVFPTGFSERVRKVSAPGLFNTLQMGLLAKMLDYAGALRTPLIDGVVTLGLKLDDLLNDDAKLTAFIGESVVPVWHASGTCRMGRADDRMAVTDNLGVVRGVEGLRICDASIFPSIPRANTNTPTLMMTERIADLIKAGRSH